MDKKQKRRIINAAIAAVTPEEISAHMPPPAPVFEGSDEVKVLMPLSRRQVRYAVAAKQAAARQQNKILGFIHLMVKATKPALQPALEVFAGDELPAGMTGDRFAKILKDAGKEATAAIKGVLSSDSKSEQDEIDEAVQEGFANELSDALIGYTKTMHPKRKLAQLNFSIYSHEGRWVVAAERCNCSVCNFRRMMDRMVSVKDRPQEEVDAEIAELLQQHPGAAEVTSLDGLDLSDHSDEDRVRVSEEFKGLIMTGFKVFDLGYGNTPRFMSINTKSKVIEFDLGALVGLPPIPGVIFGSGLGDLAEMLQRATSADGKPDSSGEKPKRRRGPFGWIADMVTGRA